MSPFTHDTCLCPLPLRPSSEQKGFKCFLGHQELRGLCGSEDKKQMIKVRGGIAFPFCSL